MEGRSTDALSIPGVVLAQLLLVLLHLNFNLSKRNSRAGAHVRRLARGVKGPRGKLEIQREGVRSLSRVLFKRSVQMEEIRSIVLQQAPQLFNAVFGLIFNGLPNLSMYVAVGDFHFEHPFSG